MLVKQKLEAFVSGSGGSKGGKDETSIKSSDTDK